VGAEERDGGWDAADGIARRRAVENPRRLESKEAPQYQLEIPEELTETRGVDLVCCAPDELAQEEHLLDMVEVDRDSLVDDVPKLGSGLRR